MKTWVLAATIVTSIPAAQADRNGRIVVTVTNEHGGPVAGLTADDFSVAVDSHGADIVNVSSEPEPLSLAVIFDHSASQAGNLGMRRLPEDAKDALLKVVRPGDSVRFGVMSGTVTMRAPVGVTKRELESVIDKLPEPVSYGASPLWDAVDAGVQSLASAPGRRLIVIATDGRSTGSRLSAEEAARNAALTHVAVSFIDEGGTSVLRQDTSSSIAVRASPVLEWVSRLTGGSYVLDPFATGQAHRVSASSEIARAVADERVHYTLTVPVPDDQKFHEIRVRVLLPGCTVRAPSVIHADSK